MGLVAAISLAALLLFMADMAKAGTIVLDKDTVVVRGSFDGKMAGKFIMDVSKIEGDEVVVFIDSPGGSISALQEMQAFMVASGKEFTCISLFAASAGSALFEQCDTRLVMRNGTLMFHNASYGLMAQPEPQVQTYNKYVLEIIKDLEVKNAKALGQSYEEYRMSVRDDLWLFGDKAVSYKAADDVVDVTCSPELFKIRTLETMRVFIFEIKLEWSGCPLITYPVSINGEEQMRHIKEPEEVKTLNSILMPRVEYIKWARKNNLSL